MIKFLKGLKLEILLNIKKYVSDFMLIDKIYWTTIQVKIAQSVLDAFRQMHLNLDKFLNTNNVIFKNIHVPFSNMRD